MQVRLKLITVNIKTLKNVLAACNAIALHGFDGSSGSVLHRADLCSILVKEFGHAL